MHMAKPPKTEFVGPYDFSPSYAVPDDFSQYRLAGMEEKYQLAGMRMLELGFQDEAEMFYQKAHDLNPKAFAPALNLGIIAGKKGKYVEAFKFLNAAKLIDPLRPEVLANIADIYMQQNKNDKALYFYEKCLEIKPNFYVLRSYYALCLLKLGRFEEGWEQYEIQRDVEERPYTSPYWTGQRLKNKTIIVYCEGGFGDSVMMARYLPRLKDQGCKILLCAFQKEMQFGKLLTECGAYSIHYADEPIPPHDYHCGLLSLPHRFPSPTPPAPINFIKVSDSCRKKWEKLLVDVDYRNFIKVGLCWAGNPAHRMDNKRSLAFSQLEPLLDIPHVKFVSLQKGVAANDCKGTVVHNFSKDMKTFEDTAAIIEKLDLVISVDTAPVHVAGTMGKPVWMLSYFPGDWRWGTKGTKGYWYDSVKVLRKWTMKQLKEDLKTYDIKGNS